MDKNKIYLLVIFIVSLIIYIPHLDVVSVNIMEARNFISAREMLNYGNWIHTTMNLEPRYEKPPLPTWLTAISAAVFGTKSLFGLRLPAVISVIFLIFTFYKLNVLLLKNIKQALCSTLILATSFYIIFSGRNGQWDIFAHAFMVFAIYKLFQIFEENNNNWKKWILVGIFMALSFMSKGPVSHFALLLPFLIAYGIVFKFKKKSIKITPLIGSLILFVILGLSWGIYIYMTDVNSAQAIADKETAAWSNRNVRPFYYYWSFFTQSGIWTFFAFMALIYPYMIKRVDDKKTYRFSFIWTITQVILLSLIPEKKARYLLPVLIPMALNTSFYVTFLIRKAKELSKKDKYLANFAYGLIALIGLLFPIAGYIYFGDKLNGYWIPFILTSISLFSLGIFIIKHLRKNDFEKPFYSVILFICSIMLFAFPMAKMFYDNDDYISIGNLRSIKQMEDKVLYMTHLTISPELMYSLAEPIKKIQNVKDFPQQKSFGLLVGDSIPLEFQNEFKTTFIKQFDENSIKKGKRGYKSRLTIKLYLAEKK